MTTRNKAALLFTAISLMIAVSVSAQDNFKDLQKNIDDLSDDMAKALPFNSTIGLNWSDAYIGQLISAPPHFGVGISGGATTINLGSINKILSYFGKDLGGITSDIGGGGMVLPAYTAEARIGGFILPFDVGLKTGYLSKLESLSNLEYLLIGGEVRYAVLKGNVALPKVSIGLGVNYIHGGIGMSGGESQEFYIGEGDNKLKITDPRMDFTWESTSIDLKAQISKSFLIITPYLGLGGSWAMSKVGYEVTSTVMYNGNSLTDAEVKNINAALGGAAPINLTSGGFSSSKENLNGWSLRAFGGFSVNMSVIRLDLTGMINFLDLKNYAAFGATLGVRFQL
ncbi:MAG: hypothetical protein LBP76_13470 [Treponema sp.]|jgi:hypothetical protein|nr:hypothetical protein [Treponema sp.]